MGVGRRVGSPDARNRALLLDAAERLMMEKGYAAVSSRRVADAAGLKPQLVHYYFRTMDELFLEMFRRRAQDGLEYQRALLRSPQPLWALWQFSVEPTVAKFTTELLALANHRKQLRAEIARYSAELRKEAQDAFEELLPSYGVDTERLPAAVAIVLMTSVSRVVMMEESLGFSDGHRETFAFVESYLTELEGEPRQQYSEPAPFVG
ncbi:helix-turn-helix domain-containing protein [Gordonia sp. LSe1-13]|uniref:Helix-turn-helix domain-containing protein n=1 Tax=Gordonia sesuvii TaxID=3116777 RepID=A0ABU7M8J4_9ACTN|nr:helix-turn-helix domain-containing protein [Gordonia sp. LSe1-13]